MIKLIKKIHIPIIIFFFIIIMHLNSFSKEIVQLNTNNATLKVTKDLEYIEDKDCKYEINDIINKNIQWKKPSSKILNFGITKSAYWFRFTIKNLRSREGTLYLENDFIGTDFVDFYYLTKENKLISKKSGDMRPYKYRDIDYRNPIFKIIQKSNEERTYYGRVKNTASLIINIKIYDDTTLVPKITIESYLMWLSIGLFFSLIIYNLFIYFSIKEINYLYFSSACFSFAFLLFVWNGFDFQYFWPNNSWLTNRLYPFSMFLFGFTGHLFCRDYLHLSEFFPKLNKFSSFLIYIALIGMILCAILPLSLLSIVAFLFGATSTIYIFPSLILSKRKFRPAIFFNLSLSIFIVGILIYVLRTFGILPHNFITYWMIQITSTFMIIFLGLGLTDKISTIKYELEILNERLEEIVVERTKKLKETTEALWGEMEVAKKIQTVLLPLEPKIPGFQLSAYMMPADEVGGDYYDIINTEKNDWILIGDVSGHGVPAGLIMMMVQSSIRSHVMINPGIAPSDLLDYINTAISYNIQNMNEQKFMTITALSYDKNDEIVFSGKHEDILVYRSNGDEVEVIKTDGICISKMELGKKNKNLNLKVNEGDIVVLFTDGLIEAREKNIENNERGKMLGQEKLIHTLKESCNKSTEEIKEEFINMLKNYFFDDDVTFVILKKL